MNHFISLEKAIQMTTLYRQQKENILADPYKDKDILSISETFDAAAFQKVLANPACKSLRIYAGMSDDLRVHSIIVGVNANDQDILPVQISISANNADGDNDPEDLILEEGIMCPPNCPADPSPLNP